MENKPEQTPTLKIEAPREGDEVLIGPVHVQAWMENYLNAERGITPELIQRTIGHVATREGNEHRKKIFIEANKYPDEIIYQVVRDKKDKIVGFMHGFQKDQYNTLAGLYLLNEAKGLGEGGKLMQ